jgi:hypothetical protein
LNLAIAAAPFFLQGALIAFDEFVLHRRRGLRRWERVGHPIDTAVFVAALGFLLFSEPDASNLKIYLGLAVFSSLLITKDEFEHFGRCPALENWVHAMLFILHPAVLVWAGWLWWSRETAVLGPAVSITTAFLIYQTVYWNFIENDRQRIL